MATLPFFKQRALARRRSSDLDRLAAEYKKQVDQVSGQYQQSFGQYQSKVAEQMKPFEDQMAQYKNVQMPEYEAAKAKYQQQLDAYNAQLEALKSDPGTPREETVVTGTTWYGAKKYGTMTVYDPKPVPTFTEKAPEAPAAPTAPQIEQFDSGQFDEQRGQLESTFKREVGERKAGRLAAVSRRSSRPMLQGN